MSVWLLGQVVFFLWLGLDCVMLAVALNSHRVHVVMRGLFDLGPGRPTQRIDEVEASRLTAALLALDLLDREPVGVGCRQQGGNVLMLGQRESLVPR